MRRRPGNPPGGGNGPTPSNPNLLVFPEDFDNAAWVKANAVVTADTGDGSHPTSDQIAMSAGAGSVSQTSTQAAATGASANHAFSFAGVWERQSVTGTFDGSSFTFSAAFLGLGGEDLQLVISRSGGFLKVTFFDSSELNPTFLVWGAKLEQSDAFSGYP